MSHHPAPIKKPFFTPGVVGLCAVAANGLVFLGIRFLWGLGAVTNLSDRFPWGIWIGVDVAAGVALAAGGFTTAALGHVMHRERYHSLIRPALLTALLGYTFVAMSVAIDVGRWYYMWHPMIMWNGTSALFEVGLCVMTYLTVLYVEFIPVVAERFIGRVDLPGPLAPLNAPLDRLLRALDRGLSGTMFAFIIAGVVLSTLHQSSLGTLMVVSGEKLHPLWRTPILPLLFFLSAVAVGFPMVIVESMLASRSFGLKPEMPLLSELGRIAAPILAVYLAFRFGDMVIRESFVHLTTLDAASAAFVIEVLVGGVIPLRLLISAEARRSPSLLFLASALIAFGVLMNRVNTFLTAYTPPYAQDRYFPAFGEISVTLGMAALLVLLYRAAVMIFPIISLPDKSGVRRTKYAVRG